MPVYALDDLKPGQGLEGPAIVEAETTTVVINTGDRLTVNALGWLDIRVAKSVERLTLRASDARLKTGHDDFGVGT